MKLETIVLSKDQEKLWQETRVALSWHCPGFTHIFMTMLNSGEKHICYFSKAIPFAATDGDRLILNPETFFKLPLPQRVFIVAHEIMHCILNHCAMMYTWHKQKTVGYPDGKKLEYNQQLMNIALDCVINDILIDANVGEFVPEGCHKPELITKADSGADAYRKLFKQAQGGSGGGGGQPGQGSGQNPSGEPSDGQKGFDEHLLPGEIEGKNPVEAMGERKEARWKAEIEAAANLQKLAGQDAAGLDQFFQSVLQPQVDWTDKIRALMSRKLGSGSYDWQRPDRRLITRDIYAPSRSGHGAGTVVIAVDTSGSIVSNPKQLDSFMAEVSGILSDAKPKEVILLWCDAEIHNVDYVQDMGDLNTIRRRGVGGGGGTSFVPVFEWVAQNNLWPDALVYLTDGEGDFPHTASKYGTIWGWVPAWEGREVKFPFGEVVKIPRLAE